MFGNPEMGNKFAESEQNKDQIKVALGQAISNMRSTSYTGSEAEKHKHNLSELSGMIE